MANVDLDNLLNIREPNEVLPLNEFIFGILDDDFKDRCVGLFSPYHEVIYNINSMYGIEPEDFYPEIYVHKNSNLDPRTAFGGIIEFGETFIQQCFVKDIPQFKEVVEEYTDDFNVEELAPIVAMMWTYSHEYIHFVRKHDDVETRLKEIEGDDFDKQLTDYALETDADLCGIAVVYRYLQHIHGDLLPDIMLRQLTVFLIFWWIRPQLTLEHGRDHLSVATRLFQMILKLALVTKINGADEKPDIEFKDPKTLELLGKLIETAGNCEKIYLKKFDKTDGSQNMAKFMADLSANDMFVKTGQRWDAIKSVVEEISNTRA